MLSFTCPKCGARLKAKEADRDKSSKCPKCGEVIAIPSGASGPDGSGGLATSMREDKLENMARRATAQPDVCPNCGSRKIARAKLYKRGFAPWKDRMCQACSCQWTPEWRRWSAMTMAAVGFLLGVPALLIFVCAAILISVEVVREVLAGALVSALGTLFAAALIAAEGYLGYLLVRLAIHASRSLIRGEALAHIHNPGNQGHGNKAPE